MSTEQVAPTSTGCLEVAVGPLDETLGFGVWPDRTSWAWRVGIIHPPMNREKPHTPAITHNLAAWPCPSGMSTSGCHRSNWASSPGK